MTLKWIIFLTLVLTLIILDLGFFNKKDREMNTKESVIYSLFYFAIGLIFGLYVWQQHGSSGAAEYYTGFLIEKTLALDNIFIISMIFSYFAIPKKYQHRVLFWGILGVIVLRGIMIYLGAQIIENFGWVMYIFGALLILTGVKMLIYGGGEFNIEKSNFIKNIGKVIPITKEIHGNKFYIFENVDGVKKFVFTPLFVALIVIEFVDLIFAVDSVPAIFSITNNIYIVYTSNIFAILGLRALYFAILIVISKFKYVKVSLSVVLVFIGSKIFIKDMMGLEKFPPELSLSITIGIISAGVIYSLIKKEDSDVK
jgi:tellurite resistance protein TerC